MLQNLISLERNAEKPIFRQISEQTMELIRNGVLKPGTKIPGSRVLAEHWQIHRKTVIAALEELLIQGWLESKPGVGTFVSNAIQDAPLHALPRVKKTREAAHSQFITPAILNRELALVTQELHLDDGLPDPRLAPLTELARAYKTALTQGNLYAKFGYNDTKGHQYLREILAKFMLGSRGMNIGPQEILITRGVTQALYLFIKGFLTAGDHVAVPELSWESANVNFQYHGAELVKIKVDQDGLDTEHLEQECKKQKIKAIYLTPHHQYPTTVIMTAHRRLRLLELANEYDFLIFEDDYDYDFHYDSSPIIPLAAADTQRRVFYAGSFTKSISPVFRVGYLIASGEQIDYLSKLRRLVDRQGDALLEISIAELLNMGIIQRYLRKNKRIYKERRDYFYDLLCTELSQYCQAQKPNGGMSVWTIFEPQVDLEVLAKKALKQNLYIQNGKNIDLSGTQMSGLRLGYASSNFKELDKAVNILSKCLNS